MLLDKVIELVADRLNMDAEDINENTTFAELEIEDTDIADLVYAVEEEFEIEIDEDGANEMQTVGELYDLVEQALND